MVTSYFRFQYARELGDWVRVEFESQEALQAAISDLFRDVELEGFECRTDEPPEYAAQRQARRDRRFLFAADASMSFSQVKTSAVLQKRHCQIGNEMTSLVSSRILHASFTVRSPRLVNLLESQRTCEGIDAGIRTHRGDERTFLTASRSHLLSLGFSFQERI